MGMNHTCDVSTINGDSRLPLHNSQQIEILVKYQAEVTTLTVNNAHNTTTVNESDTISVTCTATGLPTAGIVLTRDGETVNSRPQGEVTRDDVATLTSVTSWVRCEDAGRYACEVHNDVGEPDLQSVTVFVNCKPRLSHAAEVPDYLNYLGEPLTVAFPLTTFPAPQMNVLTFTGRMTNSSDEEVRPAREDMFSIYCPPTGSTPLAFTICTLTINNVTERDMGFYNITFRNGWGKAVFRFQLDINGIKSPSSHGNSDAASAGLGTGAAVGVTVAAMAAVVVVVIWLWRRQWVLPCAAAGADQQKRQTQGPSHSTEQPAQQDGGVYELQDNGSPSSCQVADDKPGARVYESLHSSEIGLRSVYAPLTPYCNSGAATDTGPEYQNTGKSGVSPYVNMAHKG